MAMAGPETLPAEYESDISTTPSPTSNTQLEPTRPPTWPPPLTAAVELHLLIMPTLSPISPPAEQLLPPEMLPPSTLQPLTVPNSPKQPTRPPAPSPDGALTFGSIKVRSLINGNEVNGSSKKKKRWLNNPALVP
jgi:hypothetical protein